MTGKINLAAPAGVVAPASARSPRPKDIPRSGSSIARAKRSLCATSKSCNTTRRMSSSRRDWRSAKSSSPPAPQLAHPGQKVRLLGGAWSATAPQFSQWAIRHRALVAYFMLVIVVAGVGPLPRLGRSEDPDLTVKTMVVQTQWPGASVEDTLQQITDRTQTQLQETPNLDHLKSYTTAGQTTIFVNLKDSTRPAEVPDIWYQVRKKIGDVRYTLPQGVVGPGFNDEFGDTYGIVYGFTGDGFTHRELQDYVDEARRRLLQLPDISKIDVLGSQGVRAGLRRVLDRANGGPRHRPIGAHRRAAEAQNAVTPAASLRPGTRRSRSASRARSVPSRT